MRATAWWAGALLWTGLAVLAAHASDVVSPLYLFRGTADAREHEVIVPVQILILDPMPNHIPYRRYVPWGSFQDFEQNFEADAVPYQRTPTPGSWLDDIRYPDPGIGAPQRQPGAAYPQQRYPGPGYYPQQRYPGPGYYPQQRYPRSSGVGQPGSSMGQALNRLDSIQLPTPSFTCEPRFPHLPALNVVPMPGQHVPLPSNAVAMPSYLDNDYAGLRLPGLDGVRMPTLGDCGPTQEPGLWSGVKMPQISVLGNSLAGMRMPGYGFRAPNPGYIMHWLPRPVISIEGCMGINWDPTTAEGYVPSACMPESVLGPSFRGVP